MRSNFMVVLGVLLAVSVVGASVVEAQGNRDRARQLYQSAQQLFDSGQYQAAEVSFRAAYAEIPNPIVLRAIASCQERAGNVGGALQTLQQYLEASPNASDRAEITARIQQMQSQGGMVRVVSQPAGAQIIVDGQQTGQTTPAQLSLPGGEHTIQLVAPGMHSGVQRITVQGGTAVQITIPLQAGDPLGGQGGDGQSASGAGDGGGGGGDPSLGVWVTAGLAGATLVAGTIMGFMTLSEQSNFEAAPSAEIADRGELYALIADINFGMTLALAATSIVLYFVQSGDSDSDSAQSEDNTLRLTVAPWAAPMGGGLVSQLRF